MLNFQNIEKVISLHIHFKKDQNILLHFLFFKPIFDLYNFWKLCIVGAFSSIILTGVNEPTNGIIQLK